MIQIKAKQQNVSFEKNVEKLAFVLTAHLYNTLEAGKVIESLFCARAATRSHARDTAQLFSWHPTPNGHTCQIRKNRSDNDFVIVLAQQVAEGFYQLWLVRIVLSEVDG